jgi:hypothetical protein
VSLPHSKARTPLRPGLRVVLHGTLLLVGVNDVITQLPVGGSE